MILYWVVVILVALTLVGVFNVAKLFQIKKSIDYLDEHLNVTEKQIDTLVIQVTESIGKTANDFSLTGQHKEMVKEIETIILDTVERCHTENKNQLRYLFSQQYDCFEAVKEISNKDAEIYGNTEMLEKNNEKLKKEINRLRMENGVLKKIITVRTSKCHLKK